MQVLVGSKDRQYLRFLLSNDTKTIEFEYTRHIFGATDSPCYAVRKCAKDNEAVYPGLPEVLASGGFNLTKWSTNFQGYVLFPYPS